MKNQNFFWSSFIFQELFFLIFLFCIRFSLKPTISTMLTFSHIYRNQWIPKLGSITTFWKKECKRKTLTDYDIFIIKHHILLEFFLWIECQVSDPFLDLDSCIIPWIMYPNITLIFGYCLDLQYTQFCSHSCWSVTTSFFKTPEHLWAYSVFNNSFPKPMSDSTLLLRVHFTAESPGKRERPG